MAYREYGQFIAGTAAQIKAEWAKCTPDDISPLLPDQDGHCRVCLPWQERLLNSFREYPNLPDGLDAQINLNSWISRHEDIVHRPIKEVPDKYINEFVFPKSENVRGMLTYFDPEGTMGATDYSIAFFLLNGHRLGNIQLAEVIEQPSRSRDKIDLHTLRLIGNNNRQIALSGCNAGYGGTGPQGTLQVLRLAGFPEGNSSPSMAEHLRPRTELEQLVFTQKSFSLPITGLRW